MYVLLHTVIITALLFGSVQLIDAFSKTLSPSMTDSTYMWDGQTDPKPYVYSQTIPIEGTKYFELSMTMDVGRIRPLLWRINPDDCLEELWINDVSVQHPGIPYCEINNNNIVIYLEPYIQTGPNQIRMRIQHLSWGAGAWIGAADNDPMLLLPKLAIALLILLYGLWQFSDFKRIPKNKSSY